MNIILAILWAIFGIITAITVGILTALIFNARKNKNEERKENKTKENKKI